MSVLEFSKTSSQLSSLHFSKLLTFPKDNKFVTAKIVPFNEVHSDGNFLRISNEAKINIIPVVMLFVKSF